MCASPEPYFILSANPILTRAQRHKGVRQLCSQLAACSNYNIGLRAQTLL